MTRSAASARSQKLTGRTLVPESLPSITALLLQTKLFVPRPASRLVVRARLAERLQEAVSRRLTLIAAPAGFGKTTLLSSWHQSAGGTSVSLAWVSVDIGDNDPARFWTHVLSALDSLQAGAGAVVSVLSATGQGSAPSIDLVLPAVLNVLATLPSDAMLVLDDYHLIDSRHVHQGLTFLIDHLPPQLHLVISTRADPPLPLARWRGGAAAARCLSFGRTICGSR